MSNWRGFVRILTRFGQRFAPPMARMTLMQSGRVWGGLLMAYCYWRSNLTTFGQFSLLAKTEEIDEKAEKKKKLSSRERRFLQFASIEYDGQIYMTPRDFIDSVSQESPRARVRRKNLTDSEVNRLLSYAPKLSKSSEHLFRNMDDKGIISYTEYLFLLCVLTKPRSGFHIAFNMFDMDGNHRVDKKEFLVIQAVTLMLRSDGKMPAFDSYLENDYTPKKSKRNLQEIFSRGRTSSSNQALYGSAASFGVKYEAEVKTMVDVMSVQDTSLMVHFFGKNGKNTLSYEDFCQFADDLQSEVLEIEFNEFSRGKATMSELDFARILLRYTVVHADDYQAYLKRVRERMPEQTGINFVQFRQFCQFLNNLDDFTIAMKMYTFADLAVSQDEFSRAVKVSTGSEMDPHVIRTVFNIFDVDGDGELSHSEFIAVMKDRIHRGFRSHLVHTEGWHAFKKCVREAMKSY